MKFTINKSILLDALVLTGKGVAQKSVIPIMMDYLFQIDGNKVTVTGGSEGFSVSKTLELLVDPIATFTKAIAIPSSKLLNIIKAIPEQPILFTITEKKDEKKTVIMLKIKSSTGTFTIPVEEGADYPLLAVSGSESFDVELQPLLASLNKTLFACGTDEQRPALTGVHLKFVDGKALLVSCNGGLLSISSMEVEKQLESSYIIPTKILSVLQQVASGEKIKIAIGDNSIHITDSIGLELKSLLIDDKYVAYESVIPLESDKHVIVDKNQLVGAIKRVALFTEINTDVFKISFSKSKCVLTAKNVMGEHATEELSIQYDGEPIDIGASGKQFTTCLSKLDGEVANIILSTNARPMLLVDDPATIAQKQDLILVMPFTLSF